jgi:hypothetical protein
MSHSHISQSHYGDYLGDLEKQETMKNLLSNILANLTLDGKRYILLIEIFIYYLLGSLDEILALNGILGIIQTLSIQLSRIETVCTLLMTSVFSIFHFNND